MPLPNLKPVGGFRIVYEYADRLSGRGHKVKVYFPVFVPKIKYRRPFIVRYIKAKLHEKKIADWFHFKNHVEFKVIPQIDDSFLDESDVVVATAVPTAYEVKKLNDRKGNKHYLIQHYEIWDGVEYANNSYRLKLTNIVIAKWLESKLHEIGATVEACIPNAIDSEKFFIKVIPEMRNKYRIASIYHEDPSKGFKDALSAILEVKKINPRTEAILFGVFKRPKTLPEWIEYYYNPDQDKMVDIYNQASIFISSSITEGFGLPGMEALACGCALVSTDSFGIREYAVHEKTALLSAPEDPISLAKNIVTLIDDNILRVELAQRGNKAVERFNWEKNIDKIEAIFSK